MSIELGNRILISGNPGSGKTTLALLIGSKKGLPVVHLDRIGFTRDWTPVPLETFRASLEEVIGTEGWILDGDTPREVELRLNSADTIIYIKLNRMVCMLRVIKRLIASKRRPRTDIAPGCGDAFNSLFIRGLKFIWEYDRKHRSFDPKLLDNYNGSKKVIRIESVRELNAFEAELSKSA